MKKSNFHIFILFTSILLLASSCSVKKYIPENEVLFKTIKISSKGRVKNQVKVKEEVKNVIRPKPNSTILGSRLGLWVHFKAQKEKPNFLIKYFDKKIGEKPVYLSDIDLKRTEHLIQNRLENRGYYYHSIQIDKIEKSGEVNCKLLLKSPYVIHSYQVTTDSLTIYREIAKSLPNSDLKKGTQFNLEEFKLERERIDADLKSKGYYNFNSDFLLFEIDTNQLEGKQFNLFVRLKKEVPHLAIVPYQLNNIHVFPNYSINGEGKQPDSTIINNIYFIQDTVFFLPNRLEPFLLFESGKYYDPKISRRTTQRLSSIGSYQFVNIQFEETDLNSNDSIGKLNAFVYLSPLKKRALRFELQGVTKSNSFSGPSFAMTHTNRNLFKGGEIINFSAKVGYEKQFFSKENEGLSSTQLAIKVDLLVPRLLSPIPMKNKFAYTIPKTKISAGIEMLNRSKLYQLTSFNGSFGYLWKSSQYVYHEVNPFSASYVRLGNTSEAFNEILNENPFLKSSFEQELIAGLTYNLTFTQLSDPKKLNPLFFSSNFDIAGNTLSLLENGTGENGKQTVLGIEYAQYAKLDADIRYHLKVGKNQTLISRVFAGYGLAYGNSSTLPFSKQYFSGGPYSIRAFRIRSLGPGTYQPDDNNISFFDQAGDIRLETNLEYRFPLFSYLKGALFVDAGNVWLREENEALPGGKFSSNFIHQLGVGTGVGFRFDIQSFVIRFDLAAPLQKPYETTGKQFKLDVSETILNFALGYPF